MKQPKVIFLDAVGTLFGIRGTVGELYAMLARQSGVEVAAEALDAAFIQSFRSSPAAAFPGVNPIDIPTHEYNWWKVIAMQTFQQVGVSNSSPTLTVCLTHYTLTLRQLSPGLSIPMSFPPYPLGSSPGSC